MRYPVYIALRYFLPRRASALIAVISLISMTGIGLGVWAFLVVISVQSGMEDQLRSQLLGVQAHLNITERQGVRDYGKVVEVVRQSPYVSGAAPAFLALGLLMSDNGRQSIVEIQGIDPESSPTVMDISRYLRIGALSDLSPNSPPSTAAAGGDSTADEAELVGVEELEPTVPPIFIGQEMAKEVFRLYVSAHADEARETELLQTALDRRVDIMVPMLGQSLSRSEPEHERFVIKGIVRTGYYSFDSSLVLMHISEAQRLFHRGDVVERVIVKLKEPSVENTWRAKEDLDERLERAFPDRFLVVETWMQQNRVLTEALGLEKKVMAGILAVIILVATFSVASTLVMMILTKRRDIGILRAMGASRRGVLSVFVCLGLVLCSVGVLTGCVLGYVTCRLIEILEIQIPGGGDIYYAKTLPVQMHWEFFAFVILFTFGVGLLCSLVPALMAARLVPVEAIRHE
ncbi:ABC transporter permease [bacterium]|nr:ABC transporter permease [bacterium]